MGQRGKRKEEREKSKEKREAHYPSDVLDKEARKPRRKDTPGILNSLKETSMRDRQARLSMMSFLKLKYLPGNISQRGEKRD